MEHRGKGEEHQGEEHRAKEKHQADDEEPRRTSTEPTEGKADAEE